jgi:hypothetical protein
MALALHACATSAAGGGASTSTAANSKPREPSRFELRWQQACETGGQLGAISSRGLLHVCDEAASNAPAFCSEEAGDGASSAIRAALAGVLPELQACLRGADQHAWVKVATTRACTGAGSPGLSSQAVSCVTARVQQTLSGMDTGPIEDVIVTHVTGSPAPVPVGARGSLSKSYIRSVIHGRIAEVRACYEDALEVWPNLAGRTTVRFVIGPDGRISVVATEASELRNPSLECCINTAVHGWRFAKPEGGGIVVVYYPFILEQRTK